MMPRAEYNYRAWQALLNDPNIGPQLRGVLGANEDYITRNSNPVEFFSANRNFLSVLESEPGRKNLNALVQVETQFQQRLRESRFTAVASVQPRLNGEAA